MDAYVEMLPHVCEFVVLEVVFYKGRLFIIRFFYGCHFEYSAYLPVSINDFSLSPWGTVFSTM